MGKRLQGVVFGLIVGVIVAGGAAYAAFVVPNVDPQPTDRYYGCFSSVGKLKASTVQVNNAPTQCPAASDVIRSWYAGAPSTPVQRGAAGRVIDLSQDAVAVAIGAVFTYDPVPTADCRRLMVELKGISSGASYPYGTTVTAMTMLEPGGAATQMGQAQQFNPTNPDVLLNGINYLGGSGLADSVAAYSSIQVNNSGPSNLTIGHVRVYCLPY